MTRPSTVTASPSQTFRADRFSIGLAVLGFALACALGAVLFVPDRETSAALSPTAATLPPTSAPEPPPSTAPTPATSSVPFSMPASLDGTWETVDGSTRAGFSADALTDLTAVVTAGDDSTIRYVLTRPSVVGDTSGPTVPAGMVLEGSIEMNGVQRPIRSVGSLFQTTAGLHLSFPLTIDPPLFDMSGTTMTVAVELILRPS